MDTEGVISLKLRTYQDNAHASLGRKLTDLTLVLKNKDFDF